MKALVTGGTGFLGINLIQQLLEKGWQVTALHRANSNVQELQKLNVDLVVADMLDTNSLHKVVDENLDAIFHVAGDTNMWSRNNDRQFATNVTATKNLADVAIAKNTKRFIHTSSIAAYGFHPDTVDENTPSSAMISGVNYLRTKFLGEQAVKIAVKEQGLDAVFLNPCAIIGPYDRHNWAQLFTMISNDTLPGVPPGEGSYCHVREVAAAHIAAFERGKKGENYILAGVDCSFLEVVNKISTLLGKKEKSNTVPSSILAVLGWSSNLLSKFTGKEPNMTPEKAKMVSKRVVANSAKARSELDYKDDISIDEMLTDSYNWLKSEQLI